MATEWYFLSRTLRHDRGPFVDFSNKMSNFSHERITLPTALKRDFAPKDDVTVCRTAFHVCEQKKIEQKKEPKKLILSYLMLIYYVIDV